MKGSKKKGLWRGLTAVSSSLLAFSVSATVIANSMASSINVQLGTTNYKVEKTGEDTTDTAYYESEFDSVEELLAEKQKVAAEISQEGTVLFKNINKALPLNKASEKVTVWGLNSNSPTLGGLIGSTISADYENGQKTYGIMESLAERGFSVNTVMQEFYASDVCAPYYRKAAFFGQEVPGHSLVPSFGPMYEPAGSYDVGELPSDLYTEEVLASAKDTAAIVFLSRDSSEASDYSTSMKAVNGDSFTVPLALSQYERDMIRLAKENSNGKVIVMLNSDMTMEIEELKQDDNIDAIVWTGLPGAFGFLGVADVLAGDVNPSGHISDTYAVSSLSAPAMVNFGIYTYANSSKAGKDAVLTAENKADWYLVESEGIYVGYKYYETRYEDAVLGQGSANAAEGSTTGSAWNYADEVTYPFGYGLSYTTFEQELESVEVTVGGTGTAKVKVTNTGDVAGKSAVQLYLQSPYTAGGLEKAAIQLLDFGKTGILEPGASETLTIEFDPQYMASYDEDVQKADGTMGAWVLEEGDYYFTVGNGAHQALNNVLAHKKGSADGLVTITEDETINPDNVKKVALGTDIETYSVNVQNALQDADLNNLIPDSVEYVTRADWTRGWNPVKNIMPTEEMMKGLTNNTRSLTKNGDGVQWGVDSGLKLIDFLQVDEAGDVTGVVDLNDPKWDQLISQITLSEAVNFLEQGADEFEVIGSIGLNNVFLNDGPVGFVKDQVPGYTAKWNPSLKDEPTYVGEDDEYATYSMASMPTEPVVAATFNKELVEREGEIFGEDSLWSNVSSIMAPGLNIHRAAYCSRNHEYYSEDAMLTNRMGVAVSTGGSRKGLMAEPKHFAFNHQEANRSGLSTFFHEQAGREIELRAFQGALQSNTAKGLMTTFNRIGTVYGGGAEGMLKQILRKEWGYTGFVISDMINGADYMNWRDQILGGGGTCLNSDAYNTSTIGSMQSAANMKLIEQDTVFQQEMQTALKYTLYSFAGSNAMNGVSRNTKIVYVMTWWQKAAIGADIAFGILALLFLSAYVVSLKKSKKEQQGV